jgi:hypothetical protein
MSNSGPLNIEPALTALAAALHGEGPAVEISIGDDGALMVGHVAMTRWQWSARPAPPEPRRPPC